jgi:tRNA(Ile2) C34 agmatinyltransferase TiaS
MKTKRCKKCGAEMKIMGVAGLWYCPYCFYEERVSRNEAIELLQAAIRTASPVTLRKVGLAG